MTLRRSDFTRAGAAILWTIAAILLALRVPGMKWLVEKVLERAIRSREKRTPKPDKRRKIIKTGRLSKAEIRQMHKEASDVAHGPRQLHLPPLPAEILREIIRCATDTYPSPFSIHRFTPLPPFEAFPMPILDREMQRKLHALSMREKVAVSQVSKLWREMSKEFLFNSIRIRHIRQIWLLGRAFEEDERRMGDRSKRGTAPRWVRELWVDMDNGRNQTNSDLEWLSKPSFSHFLKRCPNIVVFRGLGREPFREFRANFQRSRILEQILCRNVEEGGLSSEEPSHNSRRIELSLFASGDPFFPLLPPPSNSGTTPHQLVLSSVCFLELCPSFRPIEVGHPRGAVILPNLQHLTVSGPIPAAYATKLEMPHLHGITYSLEFPSNPLDNDSFLQLLTKYGAGLKELAIPHKTSPQVLNHVRMHCTNLETFSVHWEQLAKCPPSVITVGVFGLEGVVYNGQDPSAIIAFGALVDAAPALQEVRDLSWRSGVVRKRAIRNCNSQDAPAHAHFWSEIFRAFSRAGSHIRLVDWRGRVVDPVRAGELDDGDRFMDEVIAPAVIWGSVYE
ncbi:hypothetical protein M407DRAFT_24987 [Tulasnella calospora MUT 4182]|uniref:Uncharacterized protein n=1 Tax=Tulasnella calospora MUT 4182 TaxID=1051891 RepID=A0A0C3Q7S9_9AGAM|nr:hypothetical protein M407DRAFT_24987 [Tulasnella calospora MUT 4182]